MNKYLTRIICAFIPSKKLRKRFRQYVNKEKYVKYVKYQLPELELARKYLYGLNGIEIGGSSVNDFYLERYGAYCNVNFSVNAWKDLNHSEKIVNIVANGDDLPFKDNTLDYVFTSHVMEHFFDPIKAIEEHLRVTKTGGYAFMIIPHKERTYDHDREITSVQELLDRHSGKLTINDYYYARDGKGYRKEIPPMVGDTHILKQDDNIPDNYVQFTEDDHHHWSVWITESFLELCKTMNWNVIEYQNTDERQYYEFIVVLQK